MIKEEENEKIFTIIKILILIIEGIIIGVVAFIFFGVSKVNALAVNPNSNQIYTELLNGTDPQYINIGQNQEYTLTITRKANLFVSNFINLGTGVYKGTAYIKYYNLQGETCSQIKSATNRVVLSLNDIEVVGTKQIPACSISDNYVTIKIDYSYTNMQTNGTFKLIYRLPSWNSGFKYLMNSTLDYEAKDYATNTDIENQTISIINNAIQNAQDIITNSINENILNRNAITGAVNDAATNIINNARDLSSNCKSNIITKNNIILENRYLNSNGELSETNLFGVTDYLKLYEESEIEVVSTLGQTSTYSCFYNSNKEKISCFNNQNPVGSKITVPQNANYVRFSINKQSNLPNYKIKNCQSNTDAEIDAIDNMNITISTKLQEAFDMEEENAEEQKGLLQSIISGIGGLFNILSDDDVDDPENSLNGLNNSLISDTPISSLLLLPVSIYQKVVNNINGTCSPINLGQLFNHDLIMTCIHIDDIIGTTLYSVIDVIISGFFILSIRKKVIEIFNNLTSLKTRRNELE